MTSQEELDAAQEAFAQPKEAPKENIGYKKIPLVESFGPVIQGEGLLIGAATAFMRFGGCDYNCERCDSLHAVRPNLFNKTAEYLTIGELTIRAREIVGHTRWITLSGGNPCIWDLEPMIDATDKDINYAVETQATYWRDWVLKCSMVTLSPKGPGMGEKFEPEKFGVFAEKLKGHPGVCLKVVVFEQRDLELIVHILSKWPHLRNRAFISIGNPYPPEPAKRDEDAPADNTYAMSGFLLERMRDIVKTVLTDERLQGVRILPQLHVLLYGNERER